VGSTMPHLVNGLDWRVVIYATSAQTLSGGLIVGFAVGSRPASARTSTRLATKTTRLVWRPCGRGESIRSAVSSLGSKARGVEDRGARLPVLLWSARMRVLELEAEHSAARHAEREEPERTTHREFTEADEALSIAQRRCQDALDRSLVITRERRELQRRREQA
jgi:hypothetical protein